MRALTMLSLIFKVYHMLSRSDDPASDVQARSAAIVDEGVKIYRFGGDDKYAPPFVELLPGSPSRRPRTRFGQGTCATWAYPSTGGFVLGNFIAVQLKQLGLSNTEEANRPGNDTSHDGDEEERLAVAMLRQGAHWWPTWSFYLHHTSQLGFHIYDFHYPLSIHVAHVADGHGV